MLTGYSITKEIFANLDTHIFRATSDISAQKVILKIKRNGVVDSPEENSLKNEAEAYRLLTSEHWASMIEFRKTNDYCALVMEDIGGDSLDMFIRSDNLNLAQKLKIAIEITKSLEYLHNKNLVHKDINPTNIIYSDSLNRVQIIDLGLAEKFKKASSRELENRGGRIFNGTIKYMSPEQTGRIGKSIDTRSDLYSLGVTLYELMSGALPFNTRSDLETMHAHIAIIPKSPTWHNDRIPEVVSAIILKLLSKSRRQRYQSSYGLRRDLELCLENLELSGRCESFAPGKYDVSEFWQFPKKIYGRDNEIQLLNSAYARTADGPEVLLLSGLSGSGKTAICNAFLECVKTEGGIIADGKYEQLQGGEPYSAIKTIVGKLIANLLRLDTVELEKWKTRLSQVVGRNGNVLIEFVPTFQTLLGDVEETIELSIDETTNRFNSLLSGFFKLFTTSDNKIVLFLDDIHWIDPASLRFIRLLFGDSELRNIMLVGAYRNSDVNEQHLLNQGVLSFQENGIDVQQLQIQDLDPESIGALVGDTFHLSDEDLAFLQKLVIDKTKGNPFFARELISNFCKSNLIFFSKKNNRWEIDSQGISNTAVTNNVAELIKHRIRDLPDPTISAISKASCIGTEFRLDVLKQVSGLDQDNIEAVVTAAINDGVIFRLDDMDSKPAPTNALTGQAEVRLRFSHDQIQEAFGNLLDEQERKEIHLKTGRLYLDHPELRGLTNHVYDICDQLNRALDLVQDIEEIGLITELNLYAAIDAKNGGARKAAANYIEKALQLVRLLDENSRVQVEYKVLLEAAYIYHSRGDFEKSAEYSELAINHADSLMESADLQNLAVIRYTMEGAYQDAVDLGAEVLAQLGISIPTQNIRGALEEELSIVPLLQKIESPEFIYSLPHMENEEIEIAMKIMVNLFPPTHFLDQDLNGWLAAKMVNLTMEHGFSPESAKGLVNYGSILALRGDYRSGYLCGKLAVDLIDRFNLPQLKPRVYYAFLGDLAHWMQPLADSRKMTDEAFLTCIEYGETAYAGYLLTFARCMNELFLGEDLEEFSKKVKESVSYARSTKNLHAESVGLAVSMGISHLLGETADQSDFNTKLISEIELIRGCESRDDYAAIAMFRLMQAQNFYYIEKYPEAKSAIKAVLKMERFLTTGMPIVMIRFYESMIDLAEISVHKNSPGREKIFQNITRHLDQFETWAESCPENFMHLKLIVEGELEYANGNILAAITRLNKSIFFSEKEKYYQFIGLANERVALIWKQLDNDAYFRNHITRAYDAYFEWNAKIKLRNLRYDYRFLAKPIFRDGQKKQLEKSTRTRRSSSSKQEELDFAAISSVTHSISEEINFEKLLEKLAKSVTEVSGADKYALLLNTGKTNQLELKSILSIRVDKGQNSQPEGDRCDLYPSGIVNYVSRSQETLRISKNDIRLYSEDKYFAFNQPGSILCIPIILQGRVLGVIYLENNEIENIFTDERMETINIICTQAGVSIHNALLFSSLEKQVDEKTRAYSELNTSLEKRVADQVSEIGRLNTFQRFVSPPVAKILMTEKGREKLKSHRKEIAILFCDLRGFTAYSETVEPEEATNMLNMYHTIVGRLVNKFEATIDHRAGDGLMIFVNDPFDIPLPIKTIVEMAVELRDEVSKFLEKLKFQGDKIGFGIGVSFGYSTIGMVGYKGRFDYAASGRYVNLASRLCDEAKDGQILMPQKIAVSENLEYKPTKIGDIEVKGFSQKIGVYSL